MNVGIIGLGNMGRNHLRVCSKIEGLNIVGICDLDNNLGNQLAMNFNTKYFENYKDMYNIVDFVIIATPTTTHFEIAKFFIENKIHVLIEKPICNNLSDADILIELQKENNVKVMVGHIERFNPVVIEMINKLENLGRIISFSFKRVGFYPQSNDTGIILDLGIHDFDLCRYLFGDIDSIYCNSNSVINTHEDCSISLVKMKDDIACGVIENSWFTPYKLRKINIVGSKGTLDADLINMTLIELSQHYKTSYNIIKNEPLKLEIEHFIKCINEDIEPNITINDAKIALDLALKTIQSSKDNSIIKI